MGVYLIGRAPRRAARAAPRPSRASIAAQVVSRYVVSVNAAADLLAKAMQLPEDEREELAAKLLDSLEQPPGISIEDEQEIARRADDARSGAPGISWEQVKRGLDR